jgi:hypothetical protein
MKNAKKLPHTRLAEGEATGHYHEAVGEGVALYEDGTLEAPNGAEVHHQEHAPITVTPGEYHRSIVLEYDHFQEEARMVAD